MTAAAAAYGLSMRPSVDVSEPSRTLAVRPSAAAAPVAAVRPRRGCGCGEATCCGAAAGPVTIVARVIDVDVRQQAPGARAEARARLAAARYDAHGTTLLAEVRALGCAAQVTGADAPDGWTSVARWLAFVAVLGVLAVAFASYGTHAAS